jgi:amidase
MDTGTQPDASFEYRTTKELVAALQARKISAVELTDHVIARIEAHDAKINAVVVRDFDRGRAAAKTADAAMSRGERRPLLGIPMVIKESFDVAGLRTTWGIPAFRDYVPMEDAIMVARVKAAGAIILGKTNVPLMLGDWQSYNDIYGTTNNPWDLNRSPGGSSGGSSAALAAGFGPLSLGSDIGGSLRTPAHYCGVYAHKPTLNLLPPRGHAIPGTTPREADLAVVGPMARSAADLDLLLEVTAGPDEARAASASQRAQGLSRPRYQRSSIAADGGFSAHSARSFGTAARQSGCQGRPRESAPSRPCRLGKAFHAPADGVSVRTMATGALRAGAGHSRHAQS